MDVARLEVVVGANVSEAERTLQTFGVKVGGIAGTAFAGLGLAAAAGGIAVAAGLKTGIQAAGDLEQSVANISTIKPTIDTSAVFSALNDMSTKVPQSSKELGDALYNVFSSIETTQTGALALVEKFAKGAVGAQTDAETFGTAVLGVMNAYGLAVEDADHISDVFFNTVNKGVVTGSQLAGNLGLVTQSAKMAGVPLDVLGGFIAGVTKEGGDAAQNINNLNNFLLKVTTKDAQKALNEMGIATVDAAGKFRAMPDVLTDLKGHLETLSEAEKTAALQQIFPDLQARAGASVLISQLDFVKEAIDENINSSGAAASAFAKMNATFNSQMQILGNTFNALLTNVGSVFLPAITQIVSGLSVLIQDNMPAITAAAQSAADALIAALPSILAFFQALIDNREVIGQVALALGALMAAAAVVGVISGLVAAFSAVAGAVSGAIGVITAIVAVLGGPVTLVILAIVAAVALLTVAWTQNWGDIQGKTAAVVSWLQGVPGMLSSAWTAIQNGWKQLSTAAGTIWDRIKLVILQFAMDALKAIQTFLTTVQTAWTTAWDAIGAFIQGAMDIIGKVFLVALGLWYVLFVEKWVAIFQLTQDIWNQISAWFMSWWTPLVEFFKVQLFNLATLLMTTWTTISEAVIATWTAISTWFMEVFWNPLVAFFTVTLTIVKNVLEAAWIFIRDRVIEVWTAISTWFMETFWNPLVAFITEKATIIKNVLEAAWIFVRDRTTELWNGIKQFLTDLWEAIRKVATDTWNALSKSITDIISSLADSVGKAGGEMMSAFFDGLKEKGEAVIDWVGDFVKKILDKFKGVEGLDEHSPSKALFDIGVNAGEGFRLGLESTMSGIRSTVGALTGAVTGGATTAMSGAQRYFSSVGRPMTDNIRDYIAEAAMLRGMDPGIALRVAQSEGGFEAARRGTFATGSSWWPFQLHYGGAGYEYLGNVAGMGNSFTAMTGWAPGDPAAWKDSVDYALDVARRSGWGQWYGAAAAGIGNFQGIPRARGGPIAANMDYLVGEHGPERFRSSRAGTMLPDPKDGGSTNSGDTIIFNGYTPDQMFALAERHQRKKSWLKSGIAQIGRAHV